MPHNERGYRFEIGCIQDRSFGVRLVDIDGRLELRSVNEDERLERLWGNEEEAADE